MYVCVYAERTYAYVSRKGIKREGEGKCVCNIVCTSRNYISGKIRIRICRNGNIHLLNQNEIFRGIRSGDRKIIFICLK